MASDRVHRSLRSWIFNQMAEAAKQLQGKIKGNEGSQGKHKGEDLDKTSKCF